MLALKDALNAGYDEALILGTDDSVNEGSGENFFLIKRVHNKRFKIKRL